MKYLDLRRLNSLTGEIAYLFKIDADFFSFRERRVPAYLAGRTSCFPRTRKFAPDRADQFHADKP